MIIAFDLDGTISDPIVGVSNSLNYALKKLDYPEREPSDLKKYIGPPLKDIFADLFGDENHKFIQPAIAYFRERYFSKGYRENTLYHGVMEMLHGLTADAHKLYIATNKKTSVAKAVADMFNISGYFEEILGCGLKREKYELLNEIKDKEAAERLIMIGDRSYDMIAGKKCSCFCIGVLWGYGSREELFDSGAAAYCSRPEKIKETIENFSIQSI